MLYQQNYILMPGFFTLTEMYAENSLHLATELGIINKGTSNKLPSTRRKKKITFMIHISTYHLFPKKNVTNVFGFPPEEHPKIFILV